MDVLGGVTEDSMKKCSLWLGIVVCSALMASCGFYQTKESGRQKLSQTEEDVLLKKRVGYAEMQKHILTANCVSCHNASDPSAGIALDTYADVKANLDLLPGAIEGGYMPPDSPLSVFQAKLLRHWIDLGSPEFGEE